MTTTEAVGSSDLLDQLSDSFRCSVEVYCISKQYFIKTCLENLTISLLTALVITCSLIACFLLMFPVDGCVVFAATLEAASIAAFVCRMVRLQAVEA